MSWDPLVHGTLIFGALLPFFITLCLAWTGRPLVGAFCAVGVSVLALYGLPAWPLSSDGYPAAGLIVLLAVLGAGQLTRSGTLGFALLMFAGFAALAWVSYPAWLSAQGGSLRQFGVTLMIGGSALAYPALVRACLGGRPVPRLWPSVLLPCAVGLSILLTLGGALRFGQAAGALASSIGGVCLVLWLRPGLSATISSANLLAVFWGGALILFAWGGWYYAEIAKLPTLLVLLGFPTALLVRRLPLPRRTRLQDLFWDAVGGSLVAVPALGWVIWEYVTALLASEGY